MSVASLSNIKQEESNSDTPKDLKSPQEINTSFEPVLLNSEYWHNLSKFFDLASPTRKEFVIKDITFHCGIQKKSKSHHVECSQERARRNRGLSPEAILKRRTQDSRSRRAQKHRRESRIKQLELQMQQIAERHQRLEYEHEMVCAVYARMEQIRYQHKVHEDHTKLGHSIFMETVKIGGEADRALPSQ